MTNTHTWTDNVMEVGVAVENPDLVNENLEYLKMEAGKLAQFGSCSTISANAEKAVTLSEFNLLTGATIFVTFTNANTAGIPTLNVNSTGAKSIASEGGTVCSTTNPFYVPAGATVEFVYNGTYWIYKNRIVTSYVNGTSWYNQYANGLIEQGGFRTADTDGSKTITLSLAFKNTSYLLLVTENTGSAYSSHTEIKYSGWETKATGSFTSYCRSTSYSGGISWQAKGY